MTITNQNLTDIVEEANRKGRRVVVHVGDGARFINNGKPELDTLYLSVDPIYNPNMQELYKEDREYVGHYRPLRNEYLQELNEKAREKGVILVPERFQDIQLPRGSVDQIYIYDVLISRFAGTRDELGAEADRILKIGGEFFVGAECNPGGFIPRFGDSIGNGIYREQWIVEPTMPDINKRVGPDCYLSELTDEEAALLARYFMLSSESVRNYITNRAYLVKYTKIGEKEK